MSETPNCNGRWSPWATAGLGLVVVTLYLLSQALVALAYAGAVHGVSLSDEPAAVMQRLGEDGEFISLSLIATSVTTVVAVVGLVVLRRGARLSDYLALRPVRPRTVLFWFGLAILLSVLWSLLGAALGRPVTPEFLPDLFRRVDNLPLFLLAVVVAAPLAEEMFFRGFLLEGLRCGYPGVPGALVLSSLLWALLHAQYHAFEMTLIFLLGILLGLSRLYSGSLLTPVLAHALLNLWATVEAALLASRA